MGRIILDGENIRRKREMMHGAPSQIEIAQRAGISRVTLSDIERGRAGGSWKMAEKLSRVFKCSPEELVLPQGSGQQARSFISPRGDVRVVPTTSWRPVPLRGNVSASGEVGYQPDEPTAEYTPFSIEWPPTGQLDALKVDGDSMAPEVKHGEYVIVRRDRIAREGDMVVARADGNLYLKRLHPKGDKVVLRCVNRKCKDLVFAAAHVTILAVAILVQPAPRRL